MSIQREDGSGFIAPRSLYVHVPVCASKCAYCDFFSIPAAASSEDFQIGLVGAILDRAEALAERFGAQTFDTVYIGGGTPTVLSPAALERLLSGIAVLAKGSSRRGPREWTVEANPDSLGPQALQLMVAEGVTRLSVGVQSLDPGELALLGRRHDPDAALKALRAASEAGLRVSADLIAGIPGYRQTTTPPADAGRLARFARELRDAGAGHLSVYDLVVEEGTPMAAGKARLRFPSEDEEWEARQALEASLSKAGLRRYEVSNYAPPGQECSHNLAYWHMDSYVGAGPGAVSTLVMKSGASLRIEEAKRIEDYGLQAAARAVETPIAMPDAIFESIMMAFRSSFGLDLASFRERFGREAETLIGGSLASWASRLVPGEPWPGLSSSAGPALDGRGLDLLNRFLADCLEELEGKSLLA
jgi:oxygen-independent coproporphyrinogen III oxidase